MARKQIQKAYPLTTAWQKLEPQDSKRIGLIVQNQSVNTPNGVLVSDGEPTSDFAGIELVPAGDLYEDILPAQGELWAKAVAGTPTLTVVLKY